jgi:type IV secretion system protein TrbI
MNSPSVNDDLAIRAKPRPVKRFNRNVLIGSVAIGAVLIVAAAAYTLRSPAQRTQTAKAELYNTTNKPMPDAFNELPSSYADMQSPLGPPLPGDLGAAMLGKDRAVIEPPNPFQFQPHAASATRYRSETNGSSTAPDANASKLFFIEPQDRRLGNSLPRENSGSTSDPGLNQLAALFSTSNPATDNQFADAYDPNRQSRKESFLGANIEKGVYNPHSLQSPISPYQVMSGTVIPASLITGLNSDLPGQVIAQVTENVYDTATGEFLLIPQGSRLIGKYDSVIAYGQSRALMVWTRIIMPNGASMSIENLPGVDLAGYAGVKDRVDYHTWKLFQAAILSSVLSIGVELGRDSNDDEILEALRDGGQRTINQAGQQIIAKQLSVQPTIKIRPGWRLRVIVNKDLVLQPYGD